MPKTRLQPNTERMVLTNSPAKLLSDAPDNWRKVWDKKGNQDLIGSGLKPLLIYSGFNSTTGRITPAQFVNYVHAVCSKIGLKETDRVLEVGCGVGAFLRCLKPVPSERVGVDYSHALIGRAKKLAGTSSIRFHQSEANTFGSLNIGKFDVIFSNSVFHYFQSQRYAEEVCRQMAYSVSDTGCIAILDVNDAATKDDFLQLRYSEVGEEQYRELYKGLDQLFLARSFFSDCFRSMGFGHVSTEDQFWRGYLNTPYRFNVFVRR